MQPISVLVADDDPFIRQCLRRAMEIDYQLQVRWEAENGLEAVVLSDRHVPDIVILDTEMPRMDGFEAARCLRQRRPDVRILMMSVYEQARAKALECGADAFLVKGCGCRELRAMVHSVLQHGAVVSDGAAADVEKACDSISDPG